MNLPSPQRDQLLERLLRESLAAPSSAPRTGSCLDPEMLAAWVEGGLVGGQRAAAEAHVASCGFCQATLAALVRMSPPEIRQPWWQRGLSARWLVPVAATATALAIWVAVPRDEFTRPPEQSSSVAREVPAAQPGAVAEAPAAAAESAADSTGNVQSPPLAQSTAQPDPEAAQKAASADFVEEQRTAEPPALQTPAESRLEAPVNPGQDGARARQDAPPATLGRAAAAPEPAAPAAAPAQAARSQALMERADLTARLVEIVSPGTAFRWRVGPAGSVEFSADAGSTWEVRPSGVSADLTAGASPSGTVCWVVGRAGTVLLTVDGRQWRRLAFPATVDLAGVMATDERSATVMAEDGRRFTTVDGGATWDVR